MRPVTPTRPPCRAVALAAKRALDIVGALLLLVLAAPLLVAAAAGIRLTAGPGVIFTQTRIGKNERLFQIYKLRTMNHAVDGDGRLRSDAERLTRLGRLLRATCIDELPQLWNVLRGDMSLVGPRPLLPQYLPRFSATERRRHLVMPGLTGWAQVNGRNAQSWPTRLALDVWYADHWNLWLDVKILARTLGVVIRREGITHDGHATMPEFVGSPWPRA